LRTYAGWMAAAVLTSTIALATPAVGVGNPHCTISLPVTGTFAPSATTTGPLADLGSGTLVGQFTVVDILATAEGGLVATGTLVAEFTDALGNTTVVVLSQVQLPISNLTATCAALHLDLGPVIIDVEGTSVSLDPIPLDVAAVPKPTQREALLNRLLCGLERVLGMPTTNPKLVAALLNQLVDLLAGC
jgi:hypothetical protein